MLKLSDVFTYKLPAIALWFVKIHHITNLQQNGESKDSIIVRRSLADLCLAALPSSQTDGRAAASTCVCTNAVRHQLMLR